jgi:hypothetical protein
MKRLILLGVGLVAMVLTLTQCNFYRYIYAEPLPEEDEQWIANWLALDAENILVLHYRDEVFEIHDIGLDAKKKRVKGTRSAFDGLPLYYYEKIKSMNSEVLLRRSNQYYNTLESGDPNLSEFRGSKEKYATRQMHFYVSKMSGSSESVYFDVEDVERVEGLSDTPTLDLLASLGMGVGALILASAALIGGLAIFLIIVCGCPHVYVDGPNGPVLVNTLFTGAIAPQLARSDTKSLPDAAPTSDTYKLYLVNELEEEQHTDALNLMVVQYPLGYHVVSDQNGLPHVFRYNQTASQAIDNDGVDQAASLSEAEGYAYDFRPSDMEDLASIELTFEARADTEKAYLLLSAKNTNWSNVVYDRFKSLFGHRHDEWVEHNIESLTRSEREQWMDDQGIRMVIEQYMDGAWVRTEAINLLGEAGYNEVAVPVYHNGRDDVKLRISSGYYFWELDRACLVFEEAEQAKVSYHLPQMAVTEDSTDVLSKLWRSDESYCISAPKSGSIAIGFSGIPVDTLMDRAIFVQAEGHYLPQVKEYEGRVHRVDLLRFKKRGELSRYSKSLSEATQATSMIE